MLCGRVVASIEVFVEGHCLVYQPQLLGKAASGHEQQWGIWCLLIWVAAVFGCAHALDVRFLLDSFKLSEHSAAIGRSTAPFLAAFTRCAMQYTVGWGWGLPLQSLLGALLARWWLQR
jgi:hypothetical protein